MAYTPLVAYTQLTTHARRHPPSWRRTPSSQRTPGLRHTHSVHSARGVHPALGTHGVHPARGTHTASTQLAASSQLATYTRRPPRSPECLFIFVCVLWPIEKLRGATELWPLDAGSAHSAVAPRSLLIGRPPRRSLWTPQFPRPKAGTNTFFLHIQSSLRLL